MGTFDGNLGAYHALNKLNDMYVEQMKNRIGEAATEEERQAIFKKEAEHWAKQSKLYEELGEEMVEIMSKKWWQFWK